MVTQAEEGVKTEADREAETTIQLKDVVFHNSLGKEVTNPHMVRMIKDLLVKSAGSMVTRLSNATKGLMKTIRLLLTLFLRLWQQ